MKGAQQLDNENLKPVHMNPDKNSLPIKNGDWNKQVAAVDGPGANKVFRTGARVGEPNSTRNLSSGQQQPRMVLTLDTGHMGGAGKSTGYWVWDEDGNRFVRLDIPAEKLPLYKCSYCQGSFRGSGALSDHLQSHSMEGATACTKVGSLLGVEQPPPPTTNHSSHLVNKSSTSGHDVSISKSLSRMSVNSWTSGDEDDEVKSAPSESNVSEADSEEPQSEDDDEDYIPERETRRRFRRGMAPPRTAMTSGSGSSGIGSPVSGEPKDLVAVFGETNPANPVEAPGMKENMEVIQSSSNLKGEQKTRCKLCDKIFANRPNAIRHIKIIHLKEKPYQCHICSEAFPLKQVLEIHMYSHSGSKPHQCPTCSKAFVTKQSLKIHMFSHSGSKPFKCHICPKGFYQKTHLTLHLRIHSGVKPYKCDNCEMSFYQRYVLTKHRRTHHKEMGDVTF